MLTEGSLVWLRLSGHLETLKYLLIATLVVLGLIVLLFGLDVISNVCEKCADHRRKKVRKSNHPRVRFQRVTAEKNESDIQFQRQNNLDDIELHPMGGNESLV
jgi:hypothetical protein